MKKAIRAASASSAKSPMAKWVCFPPFAGIVALDIGVRVVAAHSEKSKVACVHTTAAINASLLPAVPDALRHETKRNPSRS